MDWDGNENENDDNDGNRIWESLTSSNSLVDVTRLHCTIELEQDKASVLSKLVRITRGELMPHMFPPSVPPDPNPNPNLDLEDSDPTPPTTDSDHLSLANFLTYCTTDVHTAHKIRSTIIPSPSSPGVHTPSPSQACLLWDPASSQLTALGRGILKALSAFIEEWKRA
jgi:hypothetical protein